MNRYILGTIIALLAYVGASSGQQLISQVMDNAGNNRAQVSSGVDSSGLTPVQRAGQGAQRESDAVPAVGAAPDFGQPTPEQPVSATQTDTTGTIGDFPPAQAQQTPTTPTVPVDNSIPALW